MSVPTTVCTKCSKAFKSVSLLEKHMKRKTPCVRVANIKHQQTVSVSNCNNQNESVNDKVIHLNPIVKWSGGKKDELKHILPHIPQDIDTYLEPFIGGGAVYFHLNPAKAVINDVHKELVDFYQSIKSGHAADIYEFMNEHPNDEETYYNVRAYKFNSSASADVGADATAVLNNAKRFYYLRKTCYRGMLRYNSKGEFNIPYGRYKNCNYDDLLNSGYEDLLKRTEIFNKSFEYVFDNYNNHNNFMFLDPPYDSEFTDYGYCSFGREEHEKLAKCFKETKIRCLMIIGKTDFICELYKDYIVEEYNKNYRFKLHSGRVGSEINTSHLVIKNY